MVLCSTYKLSLAIIKYGIVKDVKIKIDLNVANCNTLFTYIELQMHAFMQLYN